MSGEIKQAIEVVATHPKTTVVVTAFFTSNVWLNYGEPIIKGVTSVVGLAVLFALLVKHILDIKKEHFSDNQDKQ